MRLFGGQAGSVIRAHRPDYVLAVTVFMLLAFGLVMMYNINPALSQKLTGDVEHGYFFRGQLINISAGLIAWFVSSRIYYKNWNKWATLIMAFAVFTQFLLFVPGLGVEKNYATRWLDLGPASFQPAELLKFGFVIYLAAWLARRGREVQSFWDGVAPVAIMLAGISVILLVFQRDMGTMMVVALAGLGLIFVAGARMRHLAVFAAGGLAVATAAIVAFPHRMSRMATFLDPEKDATGQGYHVAQALIGIGSGGLMGLGLGKSIQIYGYLPEASNDSIFAVIGEEFGFIGAVLLISLFGMLVWRGVKIAQAAPDVFSRFLAAGIAMVFLFQAVINIAAMVALVPLTGIPLPFISYGGSSLVIMLTGAGILLNISKYTVNEERYASSSERRGNRRPHLTDSSNRRRPATAR